MTLRVFAIWFVLLSALSAAGGQWWLRQQAQESFRQLAALLRPGLLLRYQQIPLWPPALPLHYQGLSLEPAGEYQQALGLPIGYKLRVRQARIVALELEPDQSLRELRIELRGVEMPWLPARPVLLENPAVLGAPFPGAKALQWPQLEFDADVSLRYDRASAVLALSVNALAPGQARAYWNQLVEATPEQIAQADFVSMPFISLRMEYADLGLLPRTKEALAVQERLNLESWEQATLLRLNEISQSGRWSWDPGSAEAVRKFVRNPSYAALRLEPLSPVLPRNVGLYAPGDWLALFGAQISVEGVFNHPLSQEAADEPAPPAP